MTVGVVAVDDAATEVRLTAGEKGRTCVDVSVAPLKARGYGTGLFAGEI